MVCSMSYVGKVGSPDRGEPTFCIQAWYLFGSLKKPPFLLKKGEGLWRTHRPFPFSGPNALSLCAQNKTRMVRTQRTDTLRGHRPTRQCAFEQTPPPFPVEETERIPAGTFRRDRRQNPRIRGSRCLQASALIRR